MDPWMPEYELRPPALAYGHRKSVEHAKLGLVHFYAHRHDQRRADYYRELVMSWRMRSIAHVRCFLPVWAVSSSVLLRMLGLVI